MKDRKNSLNKARKNDKDKKEDKGKKKKKRINERETIKTSYLQDILIWESLTIKKEI